MPAGRIALRAMPLSLLLVAALPAASAADRKPSHKEDALVAAGFTAHPAGTPQREEMLARLPQHKFLQRTRNSAVHYIYADQKGCDCLYVGTEQAYGAYRRQQQAQNIADEQQMAADEFRDANWDWGAWGGFGPGFFWGPGPGW